MQKVLQRKEELTPGSRERAFWLALGAVHGQHGSVAELPTLPCSVTVSAGAAGAPQPDVVPGTSSQHTRDPDSLPRASTPGAASSSESTGKPPFAFRFTGAPCPMLPLLKEMVRFERPFITWDIWKEAPPLRFPATRRPPEADAPPAPAGQGGAGTSSAPPEQSAEPPLRSPRHVNRVRHKGNAQQFDADRRRTEAENWANGDGEGGEDEEDEEEEGGVVAPTKGLFIVHAPADGELRLGLVHVLSSSIEDREDEEEGSSSKVPHVEAAWFQRTSKRSGTWPKTVQFMWWPKRQGKKVKTHPTCWIRADSLLLQVQPTDLTPASREADRLFVTPVLNGAFVTKLKELARQRGLLAEEEEGEEVRQH